MDRFAVFILNEVPFAIPVEWITSERLVFNNDVQQSSAGAEPNITKRDISLNVSIQYHDFGDDPKVQAFRIFLNALSVASQVSGQNFLNGIGKNLDFNTGIGDFLFKYSTTATYFGIDEVFPLCYLTSGDKGTDTGGDSSLKTLNFTLTPYSFVRYTAEDSNIITVVAP